LDRFLEEKLTRLESALESLAVAHETLMALLRDKRVALRLARYEQVTQICEQENVLVQRISELEKHRLKLVADLTLIIEPGASEPLAMIELARRLDEPQRKRLLGLRQGLVERMEQVRCESGVARRATEALVAHMQGLMQTIGAVCTGVGVYNRLGAPPPEAMALSTFNTTA